MSEGDLFESELDIENPSLWKAVSEQPQRQSSSRHNTVTQFAVSVIVPGHGAMFQLTNDHVTLLKSQNSSLLT